jgi:hypothetical protein
MVDSSDCNFVADFIEKLRYDDHLRLPPDQETIALFTEQKIEIEGDLSIKDFLQIYQSQEKRPFRVEPGRKKPRISSDSDSQTSLFVEIMPDPKLFLKSLSIKTLSVGKAKIPVFDIIPKLLFLDLGSLSNAATEAFLNQKAPARFGIFLGSCASGKTRTVLELLCKDYGLFFTFKGDQVGAARQSDFLRCFELDNARSVGPEAMKHQLSENIRCLINGRLSFLQFLVKNFPDQLDPKKWLLLQMKLNFQSLYNYYKTLDPETLNSES